MTPARAGCRSFPRDGRCEYTAFIHPRLSVRLEEPDPTGSDSVYAEYSESKGVNLEKSSPIQQFENCAYGMNGSGLVCRERRLL
jgi:hypothetical protein